MKYLLWLLKAAIFFTLFAFALNAEIGMLCYDAGVVARMRQIEAEYLADSRHVLAEAWRLPKSACAVTRGATGRDKVVTVSGDPAVLAARIAEWTSESGGKKT